MTDRAISRLRKKLQQVTLTVSLQAYQRDAVMRTFDEWCALELGRALKAVPK